ncbi:hypothetical protein OIU74_004346 [Salix koriyanagi]|uniref:Uncharacterized protein n=2 Tax=Salix TaxID=40685 RepID=A0A9Q0V1L8_9ROSI|nr:hypothetical protein OIU74_004346 [Salix koriyanagi]
MSGPQLCSKQVRTLNEIAFQIWALSTVRNSKFRLSEIHEHKGMSIQRKYG